jgi:hypothetical protein
MRLQNLCHLACTMLCVSISLQAVGADAPEAKIPLHNFPTQARVEYVNECLSKAGGKMAALYQCSCAIDKIADAYAYDDFVEASTFAKYATLPGEGGGIFRDPEKGKTLAKHYREVENAALQGCGMQR